MAEWRVMVAKASRVPGFYMPGTRPVWWKNTRLWQARIWIGRAHGGDISLGLHHSMQAANRFFLRVRERFDDAAKTNPDPLALIAWQCALDLWDTRVRACGLMPKWVRVVPGTESFAGYFKVGGVVRMTGPACPTPRDAFVSFWPAVRQHLPAADTDARHSRRSSERTPRFVHPTLPGM
jgi:hypothetical protein